MARLRQLANNAWSTIANVGGIGAGAASVTVQAGDGNAKFPLPTGSQFFAVRMWDPTNNVYANAEIAYVTRVGDVLTFVPPPNQPAGPTRGQEGTVALALPQNARIEIDWTAQGLMDYLRPGRGMCKVTAGTAVTAGQLLCVDTDGQARTILSALGATGAGAPRFNAADCPAIAITNLDNNRILIIYANSATPDCRAVVATVYGGVMAFGASVQINNASAGVVGGVAACTLSSTLALVAYANAAASVKAVTLSIAGTVITVNGAGAAVVEAAAGTSLCLAAISATVGVLVYNSAAANAKCSALQVGAGPGFAVTAGALQVVNAANTPALAIWAIDQGRAIVAYSQSATASYNLKVLSYTAPTTLAVGAVTALGAVNAAALAVCMLDPINGIVVAGLSGSAGMVMFPFSVQGTTSTAGTVSANFVVAAAFTTHGQITAEPINPMGPGQPGRLIAAYSNSNTSGQAVVGYYEGGTAWFGTNTQVKLDNLSALALAIISPGVAVLAYRDQTAATGEAVAIPCGELAYQAKAMAAETRAAGQDLWIQLRGYPHETNLTLTPGELYFAQQDATINAKNRFFPAENYLTNPLVQSRLPVARAMTGSLLRLFAAER